MAANKKAPTKKTVTKNKEVKPMASKEEFERLDMDINDQEDVKFYEQTEFKEELPLEIGGQASIGDISNIQIGNKATVEFPMEENKDYTVTVTYKDDAASIAEILKRNKKN